MVCYRRGWELLKKQGPCRSQLSDQEESWQVGLSAVFRPIFSRLSPLGKRPVCLQHCMQVLFLAILFCVCSQRHAVGSYLSWPGIPASRLSLCTFPQAREGGEELKQTLLQTSRRQRICVVSRGRQPA